MDVESHSIESVMGQDQTVVLGMHHANSLKVKTKHTMNNPQEWDWGNGYKVMLPVNKQYFFALLLLAADLINGLLFLRFQSAQEALADQVEDLQNEKDLQKQR